MQQAYFWKRFPLAGIVALLVLTHAPAPLQAQTLLGPKAKASKVAPALVDLAQPQKPAAPSPKQSLRTLQVVPFQPKTGLLQVVDGYVVVEATAEGSGADLLADLQAKGLKNGVQFGRMVSGLMPIEALTSLDEVTSLRFMSPAYKPSTNVGSVTSQGDAAQRSALARQLYSVKGRDVTIGILSDSYNTLNGAAAGIASGDLPGPGNPNGNETLVNVLEELPGAGSDEGRGMAEIVLDVAPASSLAFSSAFLGQANFAQSILNLASAGSDVIVDDVFYYAEPMFQDGIIAQAADAVSQNGVPYFSAAGNNYNYSYESFFRYGGTHMLNDVLSGDTLGTYYLHDFDPGPGVDLFQQFTIPPGGDILLSFQWDQPFASVCEGCPGSSTDLDILLVLEDGNFASVLSVLSGINNNLNSDAVEILSAASASGATGYLAIGKYIPEDAGFVEKLLLKYVPSYIKYINFGFSDVDEYFTNSSTVYGHANAEHAIAVGAVRYDRTPVFGVNPPTLEVFSSLGGTPTLFNTQGRRIFPKVRKKPELLAPQGGNTTFFGFDYEGDSLPNFFGTSASAPHAAGVAALMLEASDYSLSPKQILKAMQLTAIDMDNPFTPYPDPGFDFATGYGLLQAHRAVGAVLAARSPWQASTNASQQVEGLLVYPNPVRNQLNVDWLDLEGPASLKMYDLTGKLLLQQETQAGVSTSFDVSDLLPGMYVLQVNTAQAQHQVRVLKQ
ncbi:Por secretion system C-terminal sorting domain-containing protein [Catalinimonas alkaloidigena]|uniref:Por secretion system C-terminal sorting domain-containing protein n=1 Tax=Catalinimonas alkaloidigena TaxID=1075417 RepID=A0A1G9GAI6_9BACT|nr:T9SS type A sorting domain-containing protein [Catalinimonas alkaloidigena]SDK97699.1 Por secretion system C-terminal sorting domain-containing protein [Catalinimonas alkaloidigena]